MAIAKWNAVYGNMRCWFFLEDNELIEYFNKCDENLDIFKIWN